MTLRDDLADWLDWDDAARSYGIAIGVFDGATERQVRRVVLTDNALAQGLHRGMLALVDAGVLERREDPDEQFRWSPAGPQHLADVLEAWDGDAKPTALDLSGLTSPESAESPTPPPPPKRWWRRG